VQEMPEIIELADSHGQYDLSLQDSIMYTANAVVDAELQPSLLLLPEDIQT